MQHGQDNVQEPKTDEGEKAVARVKVYAFHMQPEQTFYLYKGINFVGRDPNECTVWLTDDFICRVHMIINVQDMFIFIQDAPKRPGEKPTTFYVNQIMELNTWYPCNPDMKFKLAGLLTLFDVTRLTTEEQEAAPRKGYITPEQQMAIDNKTYMEETFVGEGPTEHNTQPSAPPILMPSYYNQNHNTRGSSYNSRSASAPGYEREGDHIRAPSDHSFDSTQRIEDLTQVVREERHRSSRRISLPPIQPLEGVSADITLPRPIRGGPGCFNRPSKVPDHMLANHREYFDEIDASSQPKDIHHEATLVISDDLDDASQSSVILPETQPTQFLATTSEDLAPNSLPEDIIVSGGRPSVESQREDAVDVKDRAHGSRSGSVVPESPVPSQQDYIPSTPAELIGLSRTAVRDAQEQDPGEDEEDEDRVPQTPVEEQQDQKQHTAMSDVSTLEANQLSESIPDSQATQEAIQLSLSSDDQPQHCKQEDILVKTEEVESERHLLHSVDSQNVSLSSPGAVKAEDDDDEATKVDEDSKPRWRFGKEVCPDSQRSTQSSSRDRSREEVHVTSTSTTIITATNITLTSTGTTAYPQQPESPEPQASEQEMLNTDPYHSSQDSDRTASREGSPKHNLEPDAALEEPTKGKQIKVEDTDDVSTAAKGRSRRGASAARPNNSESADPHPSFVRTRSERRTRSSTMEVEHQHSIDEWKKKDALYKKPVGVYNDEAHTDMTVLVFNAIDGKRTCKLMCAIARGVPIVTDDWLKDSIADNHCRPTDDYLYEDKQMEEEYNFSFREVCAKGRINVENGIQIFNNYEFYCVLTKKYNGFNGAALTEQGYLVSETVRTNVIPMIKICGGKVLMRPAKPDSTKKERTIVIGQNVEDCSETQKYVAAGFKVMDKEFILSSILRQSPDLDFETYAIPAQPTTANAEEGDDAAEKSDATSASNTKSARSRSRSASVVPSMSRSSSSVRPQRSSSTLSTSSSSSAVASTSPKDTGTTGKKKRAPKKK
ncbi:Mediator of DNA damage checkpoint protein 1 [Haplosporangium gracile]|nr:Mediator of DNA damage checkpoint protein 1 [Haplosporangium gracile]